MWMLSSSVWWYWGNLSNTTQTREILYWLKALWVSLTELRKALLTLRVSTLQSLPVWGMSSTLGVKWVRLRVRSHMETESVSLASLTCSDSVRANPCLPNSSNPLEEAARRVNLRKEINSSSNRRKMMEWVLSRVRCCRMTMTSSMGRFEETQKPRVQSCHESLCSVEGFA